MSYKVLYRKYRPDSFGKIVGQTGIVDTLQKSVQNESFSHAYIFTGPRGTGKTSTAKVLAKALNCEHNENGEACGKCNSCQNFNTSPDIIEIDAASNNGVDEIRELRNNITLAPSASKYKIYIIDEVHMLSPGAFNALLKTLEEPPAHAIFILATTEVYKVPITILSRCQRYDFKKINCDDMVAHLKEVCKAEKIEFEDGVLEEIHELSEGCLRDALSILDQTSKTSDKLTLSGLLTNYNMISSKSVEKLLNDVTRGDISSIIDTLEEYQNTGINAQKLLKRMINCLEKIAIDIKIGKNKKYNFLMISNLIKGLNKCYIDARINENVFTIIKLCFLEAVSTPASETKRVNNVKSEPVKESIVNNPPKVEKIEPKEKEESTVKSDSEEKNTQTELDIASIRINNCFVEPTKEALNNLLDIWKNMDNKKLSAIKIEDYKPVASSQRYAIFTSEEDSLANLFNIKAMDIEKVLKKSDVDIRVVAITAEQWAKEKEKYRNKLKNKKKYEYIDEPEQKDNSNMKKEVEDLFTDKVVEIS